MLLFAFAVLLFVVVPVAVVLERPEPAGQPLQKRDS